MKLIIESAVSGQEVIEILIKDAISQGVAAESNNFKIFIKSKESKDIEVNPDRLTIVFKK